MTDAPSSFTARTMHSQIEAARTTVLDEGRPDAVEKRRRHNMMTARERISALLDPGSFREIGAMVEPHRDNELNKGVSAPADGLITGTGIIDGRYVNVVAQDYTVYGGSSGVIGGRKLDRLIQRSIERGLVATPFCESNYLARVARSYGFRVSSRTLRRNPNQKRELCYFIGHDIRVQDICAGFRDSPFLPPW